MSKTTSNRPISRRVGGVVLAALLSTLATPVLASPASAAGSAAASSQGGPSTAPTGWHCRVLPFLC